jgi:DNA-binding NarL/FixJ family response regulator
MHTTFKSSFALKKKFGTEVVAPRGRLYIITSNHLIAGALMHSANPDITAEIIAHDQLQNSGAATMRDSESSIFLLDERSIPGWTHHCLRFISCRFPLSRKIILGEAFATEHAFSWLLEGIHGFLRYNDVEGELNKAMHAVIDGHLWIKSEEMEKICIYMQRMWKTNKQTTFNFTHRQKQVIDMVQRKMSNKEIASYLGISENTVKFHLAKIFSKLGTRSRSSVAEILRFSGQ